MQRPLLLLTFSLVTKFSLSQSPGVYSGYFDIVIKDSKTSKVLQAIEIKVWEEADSGRVPMYDNPMLDNTYRVKMALSQCQSLFKDSIPARSISDTYRLNLFETRNADSIYVMSFDPFIRTRARENKGYVVDSTVTLSLDSSSGTGFIQLYGHNEYGEWHDATTLLSMVPISGYAKFLSAPETAILKNTVESELSTIMNGQCYGDTISRTVQFTRDSNEYLPQAPYHDLMQILKEGMLSGQINAYDTRSLNHKLTKYQVESTCVGWDSTNQVEDPNNPGVFIYAPLKSEGQVKTLIIYEKYIPCAYSSFIPHYYWPPYPFMAFRRVVISYGLLQSNGKVVWFEPSQIEKYFAKNDFNFSPYEECFRAERFKTLKAQSYKRY